MTSAAPLELQDAMLLALDAAGRDLVRLALRAGADVQQLIHPKHALSSRLPAVVSREDRPRLGLEVQPSLLGALLISDVDKGDFNTVAFKSLPAVLLENNGRLWDTVPSGGAWLKNGQPCSMGQLFQHVEDRLRASRFYAEKVRFAAADFISALAPHLSEKGVTCLGNELVLSVSEAAACDVLFMATSSNLALLDEFSSRWEIPGGVSGEVGKLRLRSTAHQFRFVDFKSDPESVSLMHVAASNPAAQSAHPEKFLERLIRAGCDLDVRSSKYGMTPLMCAARAGKPVMMKILLDAGADYRASDATGLTASDHIELLKDGESKRLAASLLQSIRARDAVHQALSHADARAPS